MELHFIGDIKAYRQGDKFKAVGLVQSRVTGNFVRVETEVDIPRLMAEARSVYTAARQWLARHRGQIIAALPGTDETVEGLGLDGQTQLMLMKQQSRALAQNRLKQIQKEKRAAAVRERQRQATGESLAVVPVRRDSSAKHYTAQVVRAVEGAAQRAAQGQAPQAAELQRLRQMINDERKKQQMEVNLRNQAFQRVNQRRAEREEYEARLRELQDELKSRDADASTEAALNQQAAQYEQQMVAAEQAALQIQDAYEQQLAILQATPPQQVAAQAEPAPASQPAEAVTPELVPAGTDEGLEGLGFDFGDVFSGFKKAVAVVCRNQLITGLAKAALAESGADKWVVPALGITAEVAKTCMNLVDAAKQGEPKCKKIVNRVKVMAHLRHPRATKMFWLLRDIERLSPEVKAKIAQSLARPQFTSAALRGADEPGAVSVLGAFGLGASPAEAKVRVRCLARDPQSGEWVQIPFSIALGASPQSQALLAQKKAALLARQKAKQAVKARASRTNVRNQPTASQRRSPAPLPASNAPQTYATQYAQQYGTAQPYLDPYGYGQPYGQSYGQPYGQPPYDPYAQAYGMPQGAPQYGDPYAQAQMQPGFDPYDPASYGYDAQNFGSAWDPYDPASYGY